MKRRSKILRDSAPRLAAIILCAGVLAYPQTRDTNPAQVSSAGRQVFVSSCAECHGLDGRGGERAPNIVDSARVRGFTSTQLTHVVSAGIASAGMPAFRSLGTVNIKSVVAYLRVLQGREKLAALPGDPQQGRALFFGEAGCSECHAANGTGGFLGPDLSGYARSRSVEDIRSAITSPASRKGTVTAITQDSQQYRGIVRNEDNFSLQLQSLDGSFHLLMKSELQELVRSEQSLMPADYGARLSPQRMSDLVSYLLSVAGDGKTVPIKKDDD